ncbi:MAG: hypothetical protein P3W97_002775 [Tepidimonas sp.]|nr:hypothetical protein [Tepidimonas sp.]MDM7456199.1 hypothetical protein [Tepidimonas sp.]
MDSITDADEDMARAWLIAEAFEALEPRDPQPPDVATQSANLR